MPSYQLSNTASGINALLSGYILKDATNIFDINTFSYVAGGNENEANASSSNIAGGSQNKIYGDE